MEYGLKQKRFFITVSALALVIVAVLIALAIVSSYKLEAPDVKPQLIIDQTNANPLTSTHPDYSGFDALSQHGFSNDGLVALKYAFYEFVKTSNAGSKTVAINDSTINVIHTPQSNTSTATFGVVVGNTNYQAKINSTLFGPTELDLSSSSGQQVYDSGPIDINTQTPKYL